MWNDCVELKGNILEVMLLNCSYYLMLVQINVTKYCDEI